MNGAPSLVCILKEIFKMCACVTSTTGVDARLKSFGLEMHTGDCCTAGHIENVSFICSNSTWLSENIFHFLLDIALTATQLTIFHIFFHYAFAIKQTKIKP